MISVIFLVLAIICLIAGSMEYKLGKLDLWKFGWALFLISMLPWGK